MSNRTLEIGEVLEMDPLLRLDCGIIYINAAGMDIPIGKLMNEATWFGSSDYPEITKVIYKGNFEFSVKELREPIEEFLELSLKYQKKELNALLKIRSSSVENEHDFDLG